MEQQQQYVGIDLHRRRSVIVRRTESGKTLDTVRIDNENRGMLQMSTSARLLIFLCPPRVGRLHTYINPSMRED